MKKIIVFASGDGSNFKALAQACENGDINGKIVLLVASKAAIGAIVKAGKFGIPVFVEGSGWIAASQTDAHRDDCPVPASGKGKAVRNNDLISTLENLKPDLICLAGYLKLASREILKICPVMNIHPALLPNFGGKGMYGHFVHEAVIKSGAKKSGATVHFINKNYDEGKIIKQVEVPVLPHDTPQTLAGRVLSEEHKLYPLCVKLFCEGKIDCRVATSAPGNDVKTKEVKL
jgi:formyltetrahydrofolate-dependent phosphoribosylglycinamide formyltransferase